MSESEAIPLYNTNDEGKIEEDSDSSEDSSSEEESQEVVRELYRDVTDEYERAYKMESTVFKYSKKFMN